jgi:hypothetical protein
VVVKFYRPERWSAPPSSRNTLSSTSWRTPKCRWCRRWRWTGARCTSTAASASPSSPAAAAARPNCPIPTRWNGSGRFIGRIHAVGALQAYHERPALNLDTFGRAPRAWLLGHGFIPPELLTAWRSVLDQALDGVARCFERAGELPLLRLHGDCHVGNVLWTGDGPHFVDFDDSRMGPAVQDLWMLLSGERQEMVGQLGDVLAGYEDFCDSTRASSTWSKACARCA